MDLRDLFNSAVEGDRDAIERAMGLIEAQLARNPADRLALMCKGSLLTILGEQEVAKAKNAIYVATGLKLMRQVLSDAGQGSRHRVELDYIYATTLAICPDWAEHVDEAAEVLTVLVQRPEFENLASFERVRCLVLASGVLKRAGRDAMAGSLFQQAGTIDLNLASDIYAHWLKRVTS
ncbi:MAG: hypothetical protein WA790_17575 [Sulfitobacter sp.]